MKPGAPAAVEMGTEFRMVSWSAVVPPEMKLAISVPVAKSGLSTSVTVAAGATRVGESFSVYGRFAGTPATTGPSLTGVTLMSSVGWLLVPPAPSSTVNCTVRVAALGSCDVFM